MKQFDERTKASLDMVLEQTCKDLPHGGDHATRRLVAQKLINSARKGNTTLTGLRAVARTALQDLAPRKSA